MFGSLKLQPFMDIESDEWDKVMAVNTRGVFECVKAVVPIMRNQKYGKIINIASGTLFKGTPHLLHYVASKGAVVAMTRVMARELGGDNILVNCIAPGLTLSPAVQASYSLAEIEPTRPPRAQTRRRARRYHRRPDLLRLSRERFHHRPNAVSRRRLGDALAANRILR